MKQFPDAPYIVEAETKGVPPYDGDEVDVTEAVEELEKCDKSLDSVVDLLLDAEAALDEIGVESYKLRELMHKVEGIGCDVRRIAKELKRA